MKGKAKYLSMIFILIILASTQIGCSKSSTLSGPSDEDAVKAIKAYIQASPITAISPIQIVEKGQRKQNGALPYKVKFNASTFVNYTERKEFVKEATYDISPSQDKAGKPIWVAVEEK